MENLIFSFWSKLTCKDQRTIVGYPRVPAICNLTLDNTLKNPVIRLTTNKKLIRRDEHLPMPSLPDSQTVRFRLGTGGEYTIHCAIFNPPQPDGKHVASLFLSYGSANRTKHMDEIHVEANRELALIIGSLAEHNIAGPRKAYAARIGVSFLTRFIFKQIIKKQTPDSDQCSCFQGVRFMRQVELER